MGDAASHGHHSRSRSTPSFNRTATTADGGPQFQYDDDVSSGNQQQYSERGYDGCSPELQHSPVESSPEPLVASLPPGRKKSTLTVALTSSNSSNSINTYQQRRAPRRESPGTPHRSKGGADYTPTKYPPQQEAQRCSLPVSTGYVGRRSLRYGEYNPTPKYSSTASIPINVPRRGTDVPTTNNNSGGGSYSNSLLSTVSAASPGGDSFPLSSSPADNNQRKSSFMFSGPEIAAHQRGNSAGQHSPNTTIGVSNGVFSNDAVNDYDGGGNMVQATGGGRSPRHSSVVSKPVIATTAPVSVGGGAGRIPVGLPLSPEASQYSTLSMMSASPPDNEPIGMMTGAGAVYGGQQVVVGSPYGNSISNNRTGGNASGGGAVLNVTYGSGGGGMKRAPSSGGGGSSRRSVATYQLAYSDGFMSGSAASGGGNDGGGDTSMSSRSTSNANHQSQPNTPATIQQQQHQPLKQAPGSNNPKLAPSSSNPHLSAHSQRTSASTFAGMNPGPEEVDALLKNLSEEFCRLALARDSVGNLARLSRMDSNNNFERSSTMTVGGGGGEYNSNSSRHGGSAGGRGTGGAYGGGGSGYNRSSVVNQVIGQLDEDFTTGNISGHTTGGQPSPELHPVTDPSQYNDSQMFPPYNIYTDHFSAELGTVGGYDDTGFPMLSPGPRRNSDTVIHDGPDGVSLSPRACRQHRHFGDQSQQLPIGPPLSVATDPDNICSPIGRDGPVWAANERDPVYSSGQAAGTVKRVPSSGHGLSTSLNSSQFIMGGGGGGDGGGFSSCFSPMRGELPATTITPDGRKSKARSLTYLSNVDPEGEYLGVLGI